MKLYYVKTGISGERFYVFANSFDEAASIAMKQIADKGFTCDRHVESIEVIADTEPRYSTAKGYVPAKLLLNDDKDDDEEDDSDINSLSPKSEPLFMDGEKMSDIDKGIKDYNK